MNRTLVDLTRSMLHAKNMEKRFWAEALQTAVYIRNRVYSRSLPIGETPFSLWNGGKPDLSHLRIFGSKCWYIIPKKNVKKLDPRAREAIFIGYPLSTKGYKVWDVEFQKPLISRDVTFEETITQNVVLPEIKDTMKDAEGASNVIDQGGDVADCADNIDRATENSGSSRSDSDEDTPFQDAIDEDAQAVSVTEQESYAVKP